MAEYRIHVHAGADSSSTCRFRSATIDVETIDGDESFVTVTGSEKVLAQMRVELEGPQGWSSR